jgi:MSHA biogenesis protein MshQ
MYWNEVGTMVPALSLSNFFGSTLPYSGGGTNVGRFAPYKFSINPIPGCSTATAFTYSGQPFTGTITAQAKDGTTTQNYDNAPPFNRAFARIVTVTDTSAAAGSFTNNARANTDFAAGVATVTAVNPISWAFTSPPQSPVTLAMVARDTEQAVDVTSSFLIRNGRVRMENALGSELLTLPVRMVAEYYINGTSGWTQNADDSCASLPAPTFSNYTRTLSAGETTATQWSPLRSGNAGLRLSAPGNGNVGSVTLTTTVPSYLQFNWTGAGVTNPSARATFGAASGQNQQMFLRENY